MRSTEFVVDVDARQVDQGGVFTGDECSDAVEQEMLQPRPPAVGPQMLERGDDAGGGERPALGRDFGGGIEANRILGLASVEVAYVIDARARDGVEDVLCEIAVRVDDRYSVTGIDVAHCEIEQERALA